MVRGTKRPHQVGQSAGFPQFNGGFRIRYHRRDLAAIPDHARNLHEPLNIRLGELGHLIRVEIVEQLPQQRPLGQDRLPAQARLKPLQADALKNVGLVRHRRTPLRVVVMAQLIAHRRPRWPQPTILTPDKTRLSKLWMMCGNPHAPHLTPVPYPSCCDEERDKI